MKPRQKFLAFDLGAESGRAMLGELDQGRLALREVSRFPNRMLELDGHLFWDIWYLLEQIKAGMRACSGEEPESIGIDTWGVILDFWEAMAFCLAFRSPIVMSALRVRCSDSTGSFRAAALMS